MVKPIRSKRKRKAFSKRQRFEIFKRDGFKCTYCGSTPMDSSLRLDHVIPFSKGGSDDPNNIVTACFDCNSGKSNINLEDKKLSKPKIRECDEDHIDQIKEYLELQKEIVKAKNKVVDYVADYWVQAVGELSVSGYSRLKNVLKEIEFNDVIEAISIVGEKLKSQDWGYNEYEATQQMKYFNGILRKWREE